MKPIYKNFFVFFSVLLMFSISFSACRKKKDTIARIFVYDVDNNPVAGCRVILKGESTLETPSNVALFDTAYTNITGKALFNFNDVYKLGQAGVAVLNIEATKDGLIGLGIIKIEEEVENEAKVFLQ
jgi:hypothetical protein